MGAIQVRNVGKAYRQYPTRWARLAEWLDPRSKPHHRVHWILKGINFDVKAGEAVALVGVNGAGKSTLLKLITGSLGLTEGSIQIQGRVAALLELGMGFHPDFTGRQNVMMAGQLLGLLTEEILELMPQIEAFAEIGDYIDEPVRIYSSGMQVRLAFAVATAKRPDILIVDEALSVGDAYFQHKSFDRIREFRNQGTTLLLVTHDHTAIQSICDRAILLRAGQVAMDGRPNEVMDLYNALIAERENQTVIQQVGKDGKLQTSSGTGQATVQEITLLNNKGENVELVNVGEQVTLVLKVKALEALPHLVVGYMIKDRFGQSMYGTNSHFMKQTLNEVTKGSIIEYHYQFPLNLGPGSYSISTALHSTENHLKDNYEWRDLAFVFEVVNSNRIYFVGCNWIEPTLQIRQ